MRKLLLLLMFYSSTSVFGQDFQIGSLSYHITSSTANTCEVTGLSAGASNTTSLAIPASVTQNGNAYAITNVAAKAFSGNALLHTVILPSSIKSLGAEAFSGCTTLYKVMMLSPTVPEGAADAFTALEGRITYVSTFAYGGYASVLGRITVCSHAGEWFEIQNVRYMVEVGDSCCDVFDIVDTQDMTQLSLSGNVTYGGKTWRIDNINDFAGYDNSHLKSLSLTCSGRVGRQAFANCTQLTDAKFAGATSVGNRALSGCKALLSCSFGQSVKGLGTGLMEGCAAIKTLVSESDLPPTCGTNPFGSIYKKGCQLWIPSGSESLYKAAKEWEAFPKQSLLYVTNYEITFTLKGNTKVSCLVSKRPVLTFSNNNLLLSSSDESYSWSFSDVNYWNFYPILSTQPDTLTQITTLTSTADILFLGKTVRITGHPGEEISIYSLDGIPLKRSYISNRGQEDISIAGLRTGLYVIRAGKKSVTFKNLSK